MQARCSSSNMHNAIGSTNWKRRELMNSESLKSNTPPSLQSYCLPVEVSLKEPQFFTKDLPQCSQRSGTSPTVQLSAGSDVPSPSVCYGLLYNVYAVHVRRREGQLEQYPS